MTTLPPWQSEWFHPTYHCHGVSMNRSDVTDLII
ncbi:cyanate hydratase, partial [Pseudomonas sp. GW460-13]